jgi:exopolysaccharide production protein ExoY
VARETYEGSPVSVVDLSSLSDDASVRLSARPHGFDSLQEVAAGNSSDRPIFPSTTDEPSHPIGGITKRTLDIIVALAAVILTLPVMLLVTLIMKLFSGGPILFRHQRVGFKGRVFTCYKFRTMATDADSALERHLIANPLAAIEWAQTRKLRHDPRMTNFGRLLRKSSLDELPQLFNILCGDMSCVGPRPIVREELSLYGPHAHEYLRARPGLTGLWQVSGRNAVGYQERVTLDRSYVQNWSIRQDLSILFWTIFAVFKFEETS